LLASVPRTEAILDQALEAARTFLPSSSEEVAQLREWTKPVARMGKFELYETTSHFDGAADKPAMLG